MAQIKISKKSKRVYNILRQLDIVKNVKENVITSHEHWQNIVDGIYYEVYNDKKWLYRKREGLKAMHGFYKVDMGAYWGRGFRRVQDLEKRNGYFIR